ncbi:MAG: putative lipid II flippase FtsW [Actinomycetota bacterium]|nr:putative lipid II flippase FtsW [Actinomycetota bacterium]
MSGKRHYAGGPVARYLLLGSTAFLLLFGLVMVYSASSVSDLVNFSDGAYHFKRQLLFMVAGLVCMGLARLYDYRKLRSLSWPLYAVSITGLVAVLLIGVGRWGATRWLDVGGFTIQPSEFAKLACIMVVSLLLCDLSARKIDRRDFWGRLFVSVGIVLGLVMLQPDMGTAMSIAVAVYLVLVLGRIEWPILGGTLVAGAAVAAGAIAIAPYRAARFLAFVNPWADPQGGGYQSIQAMLAFGSGGIAGVGLGMSRQKFFYLPAAHTDFIFAIIGEELGLLGTLAIVVAFAVFAYAGMRIALGARDAFGRLLAGGLTVMVVTQALMNMAAVTGLMPVTGITMPLVSYGGSSLTFKMLCVGVILSVSTYGMRGVRAVADRPIAKEPARARIGERRGNRRPHLSRVGGRSSSARRRA